jgi:hypothetical protein
LTRSEAATIEVTGYDVALDLTSDEAAATVHSATLNGDDGPAPVDRAGREAATSPK